MLFYYKVILLNAYMKQAWKQPSFKESVKAQYMLDIGEKYIIN